ncbi:MAG: hypothetical protein KDE26_20610 [Bacteroidetes bacterium]|nr:hypothetical protein [Bacteroidota bacterium]MCB0845670.1 hypothetical protein [Bacteroidota bacterium]
MAKKKKKPSLPQAFSEVRYIKEKARTFPIDACLYTPGWEESGFCQILITRKQPSGKFMIGFFLVDPWCLGIKNAMYRVNMTEDDMDEFLHSIELQGDSNFQSCEYVFAHNMIFGALEYAEDLGFFPNSDFNVAKYILEEDNDDIELIEFEFGHNGKPHFFAGPYDDVRRVIRTLEKSVGSGNFHYTAPL